MNKHRCECALYSSQNADLTASCQVKNFPDWQDGSVGKTACYTRLMPKFSPGAHSGRREAVPKIYPLASVTCGPPSFTHTIIKKKSYKKFPISFVLGVFSPHFRRTWCFVQVVSLIRFVLKVLKQC